MVITLTHSCMVGVFNQITVALPINLQHRRALGVHAASSINRGNSKQRGCYCSNRESVDHFECTIDTSRVAHKNVCTPQVHIDDVCGFTQRATCPQGLGMVWYWRTDLCSPPRPSPPRISLRSSHMHATINADVNVDASKIDS